MSGFRADLDAIEATAGILRAMVDSVSAALDHLDGDVCAGIGPGRLGAVAAGITEAARHDLERVRHQVVEDTDLVRVAARSYVDADREVADRLTRRAGPP